MRVPLSALPDFAENFVQSLPAVPGSHAYGVGLTGPLGAGKTTFVQQVATNLGVLRVVPSPTFVLMRSYPIQHVPFSTLIHIDAYRLFGEKNDSAGLSKYFDNPENLILVEWPENLPQNLGKLSKLLEFSVAGEEEREIIEKPV